jgi:hypothetical protein
MGTMVLDWVWTLLINNVSILVAQLLFGWIGELGQEEFVGCLGSNSKGIYN